MGEQQHQHHLDGEEEEKRGRCGSCRKEKWWVHNVKLESEGNYERLCSSCLLARCAHMYCPYCLEDCSDQQTTMKCSKCPRNVHLQCERKVHGSNPMPSSSSSVSFLCPHCFNPNSDVNPFLLLNANANALSVKKAKGPRGEAIFKHMPDLLSAKLLLTAARIASASIHKAAAAAKIEACKKAREAAISRREAKEAIDRALAIAKEEEAKNKSDVKPNGTFIVHPNTNQDKMDSGIFSGNLATTSMTAVPSVAGETNGRTR